jgi:hypothetical protein
MEMTHWTHDRHQVAKTNYILQTIRKEVSGKTSKMLVWDRNLPLGTKHDRMKKKDLWTFQSFHWYPNWREWCMMEPSPTTQRLLAEVRAWWFETLATCIARLLYMGLSSAIFLERYAFFRTDEVQFEFCVCYIWLIQVKIRFAWWLFV